jgi:hypothetical protein
MKQDRAGTNFVSLLADRSWGSRCYQGAAGSCAILHWVEDGIRWRRCTVQLAGFDSLFHITHAYPVPRLSRRASSAPRWREKVTELHPRHANSTRPRRTKKAAERTPKPPRGLPALQVTRPARGRQNKASCLLLRQDGRRRQASVLLLRRAPASRTQEKRWVCIYGLVTKELTGGDEDKGRFIFIFILLFISCLVWGVKI